MLGRVGNIRVSRCLLVALMLLLSPSETKCPPKPSDFAEFDAQASNHRGNLTTCNEIAEHVRAGGYQAFVDRVKGNGGRGCAYTNPEPCQWKVVNLGLEKTGTSEVANLLRLLHVPNMTFASPRGAANGLKIFERCACDPDVRFILTARSLLDMVVSRMSYHHWTCTAPNATSRAGEVRCGGLDPACCWRRDPRDMVQSWALCRDAYHLRLAELILALAAAHAPAPGSGASSSSASSSAPPPEDNRLLVVSLAREGEHRVFHRLRHFIAEGESPGTYQAPLGGEAPPIPGKRNGKPAKLLRRHTNRQSYPEGFKACLRNYAEEILAAPPLRLPQPRQKEPLLSSPPLPTGKSAEAAALLARLGTVAWPPDLPLPDSRRQREEGEERDKG